MAGLEYDDAAQQAAYDEDLAAQNAVEDAKYDFPPPDEPPEGYYDERTHYDQAREGIAALDDVEFGSGQLAEELALIQIHATLAVAERLADVLSALKPAPAVPVDPWASVSLRSPADPDERGAWLRGLSSGSILRDRNGHAWQRHTGCRIEGAEQREFPMLTYVLNGRAFELTDRHGDLDDIAGYAPFTVVDPGAPF